MIKQAFEALCVNELQGLEFECDNHSRSVSTTSKAPGDGES